MGRSYWFQCPRCGYNAKVCGRADRGLNFFVQTITCHECRALYDAVVRLKVPDERRLLGNRLDKNALKRSPLNGAGYAQRVAPNMQSVMMTLAYTGVKRFKWLDFRLLCPVSPRHEIETWNDPGKCPKCGIFLEKSVIPFKVWD